MSHELTDTRITAYIFAELSPEETAAFERELANSTELQEELAAIRETLGALESEFAARSAGVGDSQRRAIEEAIHSRSSAHQVNLSHSTNETSRRRLVVMAVMAASLLIVVGLAYPYLQSQTGTPVSMNDPGPPPAIVAEHKNKSSAETDEQIAEMSRASQVGQRLQQAEEEPSNKELAFIDDAEDVLKGTTVQLPNFSHPQPGEGRVEMSPSQSQPLERTSEGLDGALQSARELNESGSTSGAARLSQSNRRYDAGIRPSVITATNSLMEEDAFGDLADLEMETMRGGKGLPADFDGDADGLADTNTIDSSRQKREPRRSRRSMGGMDEMMMGGMDEMMGGMEGMMMGGMDDMMDMEESAPQLDSGQDGLAMTNPGLGHAQRMGAEMDLMDMEMMGGMGGGGMEMGGMMGMGMMPQGDKFEPIEDNAFVNVHDAPLSTFSIDVDTASYAKVRSLLNQNSLPRPDAVRIEEFLNYFNYNYAPPKDDHPFAASMEIAACPWNRKHRLARIGIKGKMIEADRPSSNLVFLLDVSGSMDEPNKLPLVIQGMKMLTDQLTENDKVAIVVYAGAAGMVLDGTRGDKKQQIVAALDRLKAGGSTNGGQGIMLAYQLARDNFIVGGTNRVILCSDGDFNVGVTGTDQLVSIAQENAKSNIFLSVLGFGIGNHNDAMMEQISNKGNGNYAFIDSKSEARKVLVEELGGTLVTIAKDVKVQIEFNPQEVASYRLIGYENRMLEAQDFNDDKKDAGEIGAGHTVTALYEIVPAKLGDVDMPAVDNLRYQKQIKLSKEAASGEMLVLKLRYKQPEGNTSTLIKFPVTDTGKKFSETDRDFQFAASVAGFGMLLRNSPHKGNATFAGVARIAREGAKGDETGYRIEFLELVTKAKQLRGE